MRSCRSPATPCRSEFARDGAFVAGAVIIGAGPDAPRLLAPAAAERGSRRSEQARPRPLRARSAPVAVAGKSTATRRAGGFRVTGVPPFGPARRGGSSRCARRSSQAPGAVGPTSHPRACPRALPLAWSRTCLARSRRKGSRVPGALAGGRGLRDVARMKVKGHSSHAVNAGGTGLFKGECKVPYDTKAVVGVGSPRDRRRTVWLRG